MSAFMSALQMDLFCGAAASSSAARDVITVAKVKQRQTAK
jgi:hypothetical protein